MLQKDNINMETSRNLQGHSLCPRPQDPFNGPRSESPKRFQRGLLRGAPWPRRSMTSRNLWWETQGLVRRRNTKDTEEEDDDDDDHGGDDEKEEQGVQVFVDELAGWIVELECTIFIRVIARSLALCRGTTIRKPRSTARRRKEEPGTSCAVQVLSIGHPRSWGG